jgi:hypothetical protein
MERFAPAVYTNVSTDTTIMTVPGIFYGCAIIPATTAACKVVVYDAKATAAGTAIWVASVASTAGIGNNPFIIEKGIACRTGIHVDVTCTSAADQIIIFYAPAS